MKSFLRQGLIFANYLIRKISSTRFSYLFLYLLKKNNNIDLTVDEAINKHLIRNRIFTGVKSLKIYFFTSCARYSKSKKPILTKTNFKVSKNIFFSLSLDLNEYTQCNYFFGNISFDLFKLIKRIANEKYTFIDIGANIGLYSIISSYYFSKCFAFEPQPNCIDSFNTHISDNNIKNITILPFGLSEIAGKHELLLDPLNQGGASLVKPGGYHKKSKEDLTLTNKLKSSYSNILIDILTLDFCFFENNLIESSRSPKLIKIDVEGHEESVLRGAFMLIEKYNPVLFIEVESVQRVLKMLDILPAGYIAYDFSTNKVINQDSILINFVDVIFYHSRDLESQQIILNIFKTV